MTEETPAKRGRPEGSTTGQAKPLRTARIGPLWDRGQDLATELARRNGTLTAKGLGNMTAYVEEALRRENARVERLLAKDQAE